MGAPPSEDGATAKGGEGDGTTTGGTALESFLDELVVQRELSINLAIHEPAYETFDAVPDWGKKTLAAHAGRPPRDHPHPRPAGGLRDARPALERRPAPDDPRGLPAEPPQDVLGQADPALDRHRRGGPRPHRPPQRQILRRRPRPDRYAQIAWAIGGRHDRPFPPNRPIVGLVRPLGIRAMKKHFDPEAYIRDIEERWPR
jgi:deoxyribodipyrimidine photo-lyase